MGNNIWLVVNALHETSCYTEPLNYCRQIWEVKLVTRVGIGVQWVKLLLESLASCIRISVVAPDVWFLIQLSANTPRKAVEDGPHA